MQGESENENGRERKGKRVRERERERVDLLTGRLVDGSAFAPPRTTAFSIKARTRVKMLVYYIKRSLCVCLSVCPLLGF